MQKFVIVAPLAFVFGCLSPEVPKGYPALQSGDGAHATWKHGDFEYDLIAERGIFEFQDGDLSVEIFDRSDDDLTPQLKLYFPDALQKLEYTSAVDADPLTGLIQETDENGDFWGDSDGVGDVTITIDYRDDRVAAGTFAGSVCGGPGNVPVCENIVDGKFSAVDENDAF